MKKMFEKHQFGGKAIREQFFLKFDDGVFINHGSCGATPKVVMDKRFELLMEVETNPDLWFRKNRLIKELEAIKKLGDRLLASSTQDLAFVDNATTGMNIVLKSLKLGSNDTILCTSHTYSAVKKAADATVTGCDVDVLAVNIPQDIKSEEQIVKVFEDAAIQVQHKKRNVQLAVVDHISSPSAIKFPVKAIAEKLRSLGVKVSVDGAQAPGQIQDLNLPALGVDFYTGNLHKWMFAPKGTAFLWTHPRHQSFIHPLITSHNYQMPYPGEFHSRGTLDETSFVASSTAIEFYEELGGYEAIAGYIVPLLDWAVEMLCEAWDVKPFNVPKSMVAPFMRVLECPEWLQCYITTQDEANEMVLKLVEEDTLVICLTVFNGKTWTRISGQVYNNKNDYLRARDILLKYKK